MEKLKLTDFVREDPKYSENIAQGFNSCANKINEIVGELSNLIDTVNSIKSECFVWDKSQDPDEKLEKILWGWRYREGDVQPEDLEEAIKLIKALFHEKD